MYAEEWNRNDESGVTDYISLPPCVYDIHINIFPFFSLPKQIAFHFSPKLIFLLQTTTTINCNIETLHEMSRKTVDVSILLAVRANEQASKLVFFICTENDNKSLNNENFEWGIRH